MSSSVGVRIGMRIYTICSGARYQSTFFGAALDKLRRAAGERGWRDGFAGSDLLSRLPRQPMHSPASNKSNHLLYPPFAILAEPSLHPSDRVTHSVMTLDTGP